MVLQSVVSNRAVRMNSIFPLCSPRNGLYFAYDLKMAVKAIYSQFTLLEENFNFNLKIMYSNLLANTS